jgi:hypothetical protein
MTSVGSLDEVGALDEHPRGFADRATRGVSRCTASDLTELRAFQTRMFGVDSPQADRARHEWLYERNPCGSVDGAGLWLCRRDGQLVGQQGEIPFDLIVEGATVRASWGVDLMVDPAWRLRAVGPALSQVHWSNYRVVCGVNLSDAAYRSYVRAGWADLDRVPVYIFPIRGRGMARARGMPARTVPFMTAGAVFARTTARLRSLPGTLVPIERFDERADDIWADASPHHAVAARRDATMLRWRFDESPDRERYLRFYLVRHRRAIGYVVLRATEWQGEHVLEVVDYFARPRALASLLGHAARVARKEGAVALLCATLHQQADRGLQLLGFLRARRARTGSRFMVRIDEHDPLHPLVTDRASWFLTSADSDLDVVG